ncbi:DUF4129 domain-containing protein [Paenibacillus aestuarii]|uniref:DUF4129 domain-containing protein n=1 Tax=Paenibacillus aestuarii TaxID=516965 RepID=A0ABW0KEH4_9BACL|nr:DUF4129 domain-containing protein [Paenibacillus aestuarii]
MRSTDAKQWLYGLGLTLLWGAAELTLYFPLVVILQVQAAGTPLASTLLQYLLSYIAGYAGATTRLLTKRLYEYLFALAAAYGLSCLFHGNDWHGWVCALPGVWAVYRGNRYAKDISLNLFPIHLFAIAICLNFIVVPIMGRMGDYHAWIGWMNGLGFCTLAITVFTLNRMQLLRATLASAEHADAALSGSVRRAGRLWLIVLLAVIAAVAYFQKLKQFLSDMLHAFFIWLFRLLHSDSPPEPPQPDAPMQQPFPPLPPAKSEPSWWDTFWEYAKIALAYVFIAAVIGFAIYFIVTKLAPVVRRLIHRLLQQTRMNQQQIETANFTDEKESLIDWKSAREAWWRRLTAKALRHKDRRIKWSELTDNRERIRYLYALLVDHASVRGYTYNRTLTPNENRQELVHEDRFHIPTQAVHAITEAYNQARYGDKEVPEGKLDEVLQAAQPILPKDLKDSQKK